MRFTKKATPPGGAKPWKKDTGSYPETFEKDGFEFYCYQYYDGVAKYIKYAKTTEVRIVGFLVVKGAKVWKFPTAGNYGGAYRSSDKKFNELVGW